MATFFKFHAAASNSVPNSAGISYIVQDLLPDFGATLKIHKKTNFDWNQLKLDIQHKNMYMYQKKL